MYNAVVLHMSIQISFTQNKPSHQSLYGDLHQYLVSPINRIVHVLKQKFINLELFLAYFDYDFTAQNILDFPHFHIFTIT